MKYAWLEKMATDGLVRPEAVEHIYSKCTDLLEFSKTAGIFDDPAAAAAGAIRDATSASGFGASTKSQLGAALPIVMSAILAASLIGKPVVNMISNKVIDMRTRSRIDLNKQKVCAMYSGEDKQKAEARFTELAKFAPHIASNEQVATELIRRKYRTGFSDRDINGLMMIQTKLYPDPSGYASLSSMQKTSSKRQEVLEDIGEKMANALEVMERPESFIGVHPAITPEIAHGISMLKTAALSPMLQYLGASAALGLGIGGFHYIKGKLDERSLKKNLDTSYSTMLAGKYAPVFQADPQRAEEVFSSLVHFAPHVAVEPHAAGAFVSKVMNYKDQGLQSSDLKDLTSIEESFTGRKSPSILETAMQSSGFPGAFNTYLEKTMFPSTKST